MIFIKIKALQYAKENIIKGLNAFIQNSDNYSHIIPDKLEIENLKNCIVYDTEPKVLENFPMIIVSNGNATIISGGIGNDFVKEITDLNGDLCGYRYGGMYDINITIEVAARSVYEREAITDLIMMALRVYLRRKLEAQGILIKDTRTNSETSILINSDKIYINNLSLSIWAEWYEDIQLVSPIDNVNITFNVNE